MTRERFERLAGEMWDRIPDALKEGVEALIVEAKTVEHDTLPGVFTLGECVTDSHPSSYGGAGETTSEVVLYHGSFAELAAREPGFDWEGELWETLLHELLHHREAAAGEAGLDDFDWAVEQNQRRWADQPYDPGFCRVVPHASDGTVRLDSEIFLPMRLPPAAHEAVFQWRGEGYSVRVPDASPAFVQVVNLAGGRLCLVVERRRPWWKRLGAPADNGGPVEISRRALPVPVS